MVIADENEIGEPIYTMENKHILNVCPLAKRLRFYNSTVSFEDISFQ